MSLETHVRPLSVTPSQGLDIDRIEKQLMSMWSEASSSEGESAHGVTRACALNLIVYSTPGEDAGRLEELLNRVNEQHPGRTLILMADRDAKEAKLEAYVSTRCRLLGGTGKQICGEQVTIEAGGSTVDTVASAVAPLLVPDVPVYLWWKDIPHYQDKLFDRLAQMADRIVIDSAAFDHPYDDLLRLATMTRDPALEMRVTDLNWGRLTSWRTLLASFWDVPDYRPLLDRIDSVVVEYSPPQSIPEDTAPKALLLAGWLAAQLGWTIVGQRSGRSNRENEVDLQSPVGIVALSFRPVQTETETEGIVCSVTLSANNGAAVFSVALRAGGTKLQTEARIGSRHSVGRLLAYESRSEADRFSRELAVLSRDRVYEAALARAAQLVQIQKR